MDFQQPEGLSTHSDQVKFTTVFFFFRNILKPISDWQFIYLFIYINGFTPNGICLLDHMISCTIVESDPSGGTKSPKQNGVLTLVYATFHNNLCI